MTVAKNFAMVKKNTAKTKNNKVNNTLIAKGRLAKFKQKNTAANDNPATTLYHSISAKLNFVKYSVIIVNMSIVNVSPPVFFKTQVYIEKI